MPEHLEPRLDNKLLTDGEALLRLQGLSHEWVKRRIDSVSFEDHLTIQRQTTLDLDLSSEYLQNFPIWHGRILIPVKLIDRVIDVDVTVFNAKGEPLPRINRRRERSLVAAGLVYKYLEAKEPASAEDHEGLELYESVLATIYPEVYGSLKVEALPRDNSQWNFLIDAYAKVRIIIAAVTVDLLQDNDGLLFRLITTNPEYVGPTKRFGLKRDDSAVDFEFQQLSYCESFHFEVTAPPGMYIHDGVLSVEAETITPLGITRMPRLYPDSDPHPDRAHFYCPIQKDWTTDHTYIESKVSILLRPLALGTMGGAFYTSIISSAILLLLLFTIGWSGTSLPRLFLTSRNFYSPDQQSIVTALLLGPTLLLAVLIRQDEHLMTKRMVARLRYRLSVAGFATFGASMAFAIGLHGWELWLTLAVLSAVCCMVTVLTVHSYWRSQRGIRGSNERGADEQVAGE